MIYTQEYCILGKRHNAIQKQTVQNVDINVVFVLSSTAGMRKRNIECLHKKTAFLEVVQRCRPLTSEESGSSRWPETICDKAL